MQIKKEQSRNLYYVDDALEFIILNKLNWKDIYKCVQLIFYHDYMRELHFDEKDIEEYHDIGRQEERNKLNRLLQDTNLDFGLLVDEHREEIDIWFKDVEKTPGKEPSYLLNLKQPKNIQNVGVGDE